MNFDTSELAGAPGTLHDLLHFILVQCQLTILVAQQGGLRL